MVMKLIHLNTDTNDYNSELDLFGYTELAQDIREDIIAIWNFFCNENRVLQGVKNFAQQYYDYNTYEKRTLREFFDHWGSNNFFNQASDNNSLEQYNTSNEFQYPNHTPILCGELTADLFHNVLLKNGYLSGDIGAGPAHGKWAHSIQLFLLEEARKSGQLVLNSPSVCEFIKKMSQIKPALPAFHLWDILFDSFDDNIYTNPNNLTSLLIQQNDSQASLFLSQKIMNYSEKYSKEAAVGDYNALAKRKYLSRISEASYVRYGDQCSLLWFTPKNKNRAENLPTTEVVEKSYFIELK